MSRCEVDCGCNDDWEAIRRRRGLFIYPMIGIFFCVFYHPISAGHQSMPKPIRDWPNSLARTHDGIYKWGPVGACKP